MIGMVLLQPGWEHEYEGRPPSIRSAAAASSPTSSGCDGRYNIVLRGVERFRIVEEDHSRSLPARPVEPLVERALVAEDRDDPAAAALEARGAGRPGDRAAARAVGRGTGEATARRTDDPVGMADEDLVNALAQYLDLEPLEKQALLEHDCLRTRAESLVELLEMKILLARTPAARRWRIDATEHAGRSRSLSRS